MNELMGSLILGQPLLRVMNVQKGGITWPTDLPLAYRACEKGRQLTVQYKGNFYFSIKRGIAFNWKVEAGGHF